ncbi:MAG: hypothetical protein QME05_04975 [Candidatus Margulisbacteria bacterium]|nr:hypothetical protein [Candidatus Margulisiibacteriota bacterium]
MFKKIIFVSCILYLVACAVWANASPIISFQGRLTDASGVPITIATTVTFSIYDSATGGVALWTSSAASVTPDSNGFFSTTIDCSSSGLDFNRDYWMEVAVGSTSLSPRQQMTAAPYAAALTTGDKKISGSLSVESSSNTAIFGSGANIGVYGETKSTTGRGIYGLASTNAAASYGYGVVGQSNCRGGVGVYGYSSWGGGNANYGVYGTSKGTLGYGVYGWAQGASGIGVYGTGETGVFGYGRERYGVYGTSASLSGMGVCGSVETAGTGVQGYSRIGIGVLGRSATGYAGKFVGNITVEGNAYVSGTLTATNLSVPGAKSFVIDHPLDPQNKILRHAAMESPDMKNIYDGVAVLDDKGEAIIKLPAYFEALNKDYRYQLTTLSEYAPVYVKQEIQNNTFMIAGGKAGMRVSWQVTGIRQDTYAKEHPIVVEEAK